MMQATVIEVNGQNIYLEIDSQIRFESRYVTKTPDSRIGQGTVVDFRFSTSNGFPVVVVHGVETAIPAPN